MATIGEQIVQKAREITEAEPHGVRYSVLARRIKEALPDANLNTIAGTIWNLDARFQNEIYKPARGIFRSLKFKETEPTAVAPVDALARIFGIGLILFDSTRPAQPDFEIRVRAARHEPDMFYVNKYLKLIEDELF
jgi:hypothetical protein